MIKYLCDICKNEIKDMTYHGELRVMSKTFAFIKHQKEDQIRTQVYLFCSECAEKVQNHIRDLQKM